MTKKITVDKTVIDNLVEKANVEPTGNTNEWNTTNPAWVDGYSEGMRQAVGAIMIPIYLEERQLTKEESEPDQQLTKEQETMLNWMKEQTRDIQVYSFHPTGIILEVAKGTKWVPVEIHQLWVEMLECDRQKVILDFLG
ncbi:hypothetical protein [Enterococcus larvae]|uniref:hypothetical protein n=1 Tax=Enterococcus larvae TaxID=2794352 RepID=UPI003F331AD1